MDQKKNLIAGASAFAISVAVGLIVGLPLIDKAEPVATAVKAKEAPKVEAQAAETVEVAPKAEEKPAEKVEHAAPAEKVEEAPKAEEKPAEKVEHAAPAEKVEEAPKAEEKPAEKVEHAAPAEKVEEAPKAEEKPAEKVEHAAPAEKVEEAPKAEEKPAEKVEHAAPAEKVEEAPKTEEKPAEKVEHAAPAEKDAHPAPTEKEAHAPEAKKADDHAIHWGYLGKGAPAYWGELKEAFKTCKTGKMQSPIDLNGVNASAAIQVETAYKPLELEILNNGHTVQFNVGNGSELTAKGKKFQLLQVHFHTPSEHVMDGKNYPMEAHFVHKAEDGELAVLGVLYEVGKKNKALRAVVDNISMTPAPATKKGVEIDPAKLLPSNKELVRYMGSLTTPPCSEGVNWHVFNEPQQASLAQIAKMHKAMGDNFRPTQPLNNRLVVKP